MISPWFGRGSTSSILIEVLKQYRVSSMPESWLRGQTMYLLFSPPRFLQSPNVYIHCGSNRPYSKFKMVPQYLVLPSLSVPVYALWKSRSHWWSRRISPLNGSEQEAGTNVVVGLCRVRDRESKHKFQEGKDKGMVIGEDGRKQRSKSWKWGRQFSWRGRLVKVGQALALWLKGEKGFGSCSPSLVPCRPTRSLASVGLALWHPFIVPLLSFKSL